MSEARPVTETPDPPVIKRLVEQVIDEGPTPDPAPTLDEARTQPGRFEKIRQIRNQIDERGIEYIYFQLISVSGHVNGKGVYAKRFEQVAESGFQLVYGATADLFIDRYDNYIGFGAEESELAGMADLDTFRQLPWEPRIARVFVDCYDTETGQLLESDPRQNLKRLANRFEAQTGAVPLVGIEPEMSWLKRTDDPNQAEGVTKPWCYHINQFETLRPVILDVVKWADDLGLEPTYGDHEDAPGQLELNWQFDRPLRTADNYSTYRQICAEAGRKHDLIACFMPKPFNGVSANAAHHHITLNTPDGKNLFYDPDGPAKLSKLGQHFCAGVLHHAKAVMAITASTVNSYARMWDFGFWAPVFANYGWQNRTTLMRVAAPGRFEFKGADSACNPYLTQAALLAAGLDGIERELDPGEPFEGESSELYFQGVREGRLPEHLGEALDALEEDEVVRGALPGKLYDVYHHYKRDEWVRFLGTVTDWERERYLDVQP
jgi:glutamine synthetase